MPKKLAGLTTTPDTLTVAENSGLTPIGIVPPKDTQYPSSKLIIKVTSLPSDGTIFLSDGVTPIYVGEKLTVTQLTGLLFKPTAGLFATSSTFTYSVSDPSGASATGTATLCIGPDTMPPVTTAAILTVSANSSPMPIGISAPTDPNYSASQLVIKVTGLPSDGAVLLSDGLTAVYNGQILTVAQLTGLMFKPTAGSFGTSSAFSYSVTDPSGLSTSGTATVSINPNTVPPVTSPASLTVAGNSAPTSIGIAAPTDPNYTASQLTVTVTGLPADGPVLLSDGVTIVSNGETLTVAQLSGLMFRPTAGIFNASSLFTYSVTDPSGLSTSGTATLAIAADTSPPVTIDPIFTVAPNSGPAPIGIPAPTDPNYLADQLSVKVTGLPTDGTVLLSDGVTAVTVGERLTVAQLTGLMFKPTSGLSGQSSTFTYEVTNPAGLTAAGIEVLTISASNGLSPDGSTLLPGTGGSLVTSAGTWTFGSVSDNNGYQILLNGQTAAQGYGVELGIASQGNLYAYAGGFWYEWVGNSWTATSAPAALSAPTLFTPTISVPTPAASLTTTPAFLSVYKNSVATPIRISTPTDTNYISSQLSVKVTALPSDGTVLLADGVTAVTAGEILTIAQLTGLQFKPMANLVSGTSIFSYTVTDPAGASAVGNATLTVGASPDGSTLLAGSGGSLVTAAGVWTFGTTPMPGTGAYPVLLNGQPAAGGGGIEMSVAGGGNLFIYTAAGNWYEWTGSGYTIVNGPAEALVEFFTIAENAAPQAMGIFTPADGNYPTSQLTARVISLPSNGTVLLADGVTPVSAGETLTVAQLTGLVFKPAPNANGSSAFTYTVSDPTGLTVTASETIIVTATPPVTTAASLTVAANAAATPIHIAAPSDPNYAVSQLTARITTLPNNGTVLLADGVTPITVGQVLTIAQLTGLEFKPNPGISSQASVLQYAVTDPGNGYAPGTAALIIGPTPVQVTVPPLAPVTPSGVWHDPPSGAVAAPGVDIGPTVAQPSLAGDIVGLRLQNPGAAIEPSGYVSFGEVFLSGAVKPTDSLVARINGVNYAVQMDVKSTNADGSVRQAVLTLRAPAIAAGGTLDLMLAKGAAAAPSPAAPSAAALLASGYNVGVNFTFHNPDGSTTTDSASGAAALQAALNAGTVKTWLSGPGVTEYDVVTTVDGGKLKVEFDIRAYANGTTTTDVIFDNSWMFAPGKTNLNYDVSISQGGNQVFSAAGVNQYLYSLWDHQVASAGAIAPNVQYDVPYLLATGALQRYDTSYGVSDAVIQRNFNALDYQGTQSTGPMGTAGVATQMQSTGGRQDIAPQPNWTAQWLLSQNPTALAVMMADAAASGSAPWHYTDESTGQVINSQTYPTFTLMEGYDGFLQPANGWPTYSANGDPWSLDLAHMPDLNYVPYLITGNHYQLELLQAEANFAITTVFNSGGGTLDSSGTVPLGFTNANYTQPRGLAWGLRTIAEAAYLTPDTDPLKTYFVSELNTAMKGLVQQYINDNFSGQYGQLSGVLQPYQPNSYQGWDAPWQDDFIVTSLAEVAGMNIPGASADAVAMLKYMNNWVSGLFTNGPNGFNPLDGTAYTLRLNDPVTGAPYTTWSELFNGNASPTWQGGMPGIPTNPTALLSATQGYGGYGNIARAALADEITYTQSPQAIQAYGFVVSQMAYAYAVGGISEAADYQNYPQFSIVPRLPDGSWLENSQMQIDTSGASTITLTASSRDSLLAVVGNGTATLIGGNGSCDLLFGGGGQTTLVAGTGNDYMFGGSGATAFVDNTGNNYMHGGTNANAYQFTENNSGHDTIANFNPATDQIQVTPNLNGNGINTAAQLLAGATVNNGNTVLHLSSKDDITLLGIIQPSNLLQSILIS